MIEFCATTACKAVSYDVSGERAACMFGLTGVDGYWSIHLNLIPKRLNRCMILHPFSNNNIIMYYCYIIIIIIIAKLKFFRSIV
jgi:hypothetical protein